jgi:hypothetical protein
VASGKGAGIFKLAKPFFRFLKTDAHVAKDAAHAKPRFKLKSMGEEYKYEHVPGHPKNKWNPSHVVHLNDAQREQLRLTVGHDGKLYDSRGLPFDTRDGMSVHTKGGGRAIFGMEASTPPTTKRSGGSTTRVFSGESPSPAQESCKSTMATLWRSPGKADTTGLAPNISGRSSTSYAARGPASATTTSNGESDGMARLGQRDPLHGPVRPGPGRRDH